MNQLISNLYLNDNIIDSNSIIKTSQYNVQFKLLKKDKNYDAICINNLTDNEGETYFTIILCKFSYRIGGLIEGHRNPINGVFGRGWTLKKSNITEVIEVLKKLYLI